MTQIEKPVFFLTEKDQYSGNMPPFFDKTKYPWVAILEENYLVIVNEFKAYIDGTKTLESSSVNPPYLSDAGAWKNVYFWNFLWKKHRICRDFPETYKLLKSIPNLILAEVTCLNGNAKILPHIGETNVTIRGHLGLKIPGDLPEMGISVNNIEQGWKEGEVVLFSDAHRHFVWNNSNEKRFVLVFDVLQEEYASQKYWMCAQALSSLTIKFIDEHINLFNRLPEKLRYSAHLVLSSMWRVYLPLQNRFSFLP